VRSSTSKRWFIVRKIATARKIGMSAPKAAPFLQFFAGIRGMT
jgi:hypothetical protein